MSSCDSPHPEHRKDRKMDFVRKISSVTHQMAILMLSCVGQGALRTKNSYLWTFVDCVGNKLVRMIKDYRIVSAKKDNEMSGIFRGIFIGLALLALGGQRAWCVTPEFVDSLRTELRLRNMPERIIFLPLALADQRFDDGREGIWSLTALDAIRGKALCREAAYRPRKGTEEVAKCLKTDEREARMEGETVARTEYGQGVDAAIDWADRNAADPDSVDVRFDERISTEIALNRLHELFNEYGDWNMSMVAYATSPTALAVMDSTALADAQILRSLRRAEEGYSENIQAAFERIGSLAEQRKAERQAFLREQAALRKARLDSLRKMQAANTDRITYTIRRGDTLGGIAARHRVKVTDLKRWNNLKSDMIREGRKLVIYK